MKAVVLITDSEAMRDFERALMEASDRGFTVVPTVWGRGRSGLKAGDRIHPGASSLLFTVLPEEALSETLALLRRVREDSGAPEETRLYVTDIDEIA